MHFFRTLWIDDLKSTGFTIKNSTDENLRYEDIVFQEDNNKKFLKYAENLGISYYKRSSSILLLEELVYFTKDGYFDPSGIYWEGDMARQRIADWLPYEYSINNNNR